MDLRDAVVVDAVRTPIGKRNGSLSGVHPVELSAHVLRALVARTGIDPGEVDDVIWGCVTQLGDQAGNVGRFALLAAGWPQTVPAVTVNRACGSSQQAVDQAAHAVMAGAFDLVVAGGVESMSRVPLGAARTTGFPYGQAVLDRYGVDDFGQGVGAEQVAQRWGLTRTDLDAFASLSHDKAAAAIDGGLLESQIAPVPVDDRLFSVDEGLRRGTSVRTLSALRPAFDPSGVIHAGNASQISDGAAALLITTPQRADQLGLRPLVRYHSGAVVGDDPVMMLTGPIPATAKVLARAGLTIDDVGAYEVNEAFASVPLAWLAETGADPARLNPLGGAIAVGHPLGASGAILATRLIHHMHRDGLHFGLQTMCEAGGTANATLFELVD